MADNKSNAITKLERILQGRIKKFMGIQRLRNSETLNSFGTIL